MATKKETAAAQAVENAVETVEKAEAKTEGWLLYKTPNPRDS